MTKPSSPFAGVKLSDLASNPSPGPLDQQLFRPSPPPAAPPSTPAQQETPQRRTDVKTQRRQDPKTPFRQDVNSSRRKDVNVSGQQAVKPYDINEETFERETVRVSRAEQRAVEQLKLSLRDLLDRTVGKNDIFRAGLHFLLEDFHANGEHSEVVSRLREKAQ